MTEHPAKVARCTKRQIEVFEQIGSGVTNPSCGVSTLNALSLKGLIDSWEQVVGRDGFGEIKLPRWYVPIPVHMQWCKWCSEQPESEANDGTQ